MKWLKFDGNIIEKEKFVFSTIEGKGFGIFRKYYVSVQTLDSKLHSSFFNDYDECLDVIDEIYDQLSKK